VTLTEMTMVATITLGTVASAAMTMDVPAMSKDAQATVSLANCRQVNTAILAFYAERQAQPTSLADVDPYVQGDISAYRVVRGKAVGPGCKP
jgi:hypothetical protein